MQPLVESIPESRLADVLLGELFPRQEVDDTFVDLVLDDLELGDPPEADDYASYEIVRDAFATSEFMRVRDTRYDHIVTVEFPREFKREVFGDDTAQAPKFSAPYERIEIEPAESARIPMERISVERMVVEPVTAHGEIVHTAVASDDEMQLELEDLEIENDFFAKGGDGGFERVELDDDGVDVDLDDREESGARFMSYAQALPFPLYSAPFERVELGELPTVTPKLADPGDSTDVIVPRRAASTRVVATVFVLACAVAAAVGLALLVVRDATV